MRRVEKGIAAAVFLIFILSGGSSAEIIGRSLVYPDGNTVLEGYLAYDNASTAKRPAVIIVHEWNGLGTYAKKRTEQIAALGYIAFAADIYGRGVRPSTMDESAKQASIYRNDKALMRKRINAAFVEVAKNMLVDKNEIAVMGYCFGGGVALELARSGAPVVAAISFHGNLDTKEPGDARNIKGKVLVFHGSLDPNVTAESITAFQKEMNSANVDWQMVVYGGAVHGFTNPANGTDIKKGVAYNGNADRRSWEALKIFLKEVFKR